MPFNNSSFPISNNNFSAQSPKAKDLINSLLNLPDYADHFEIHHDRLIPEPFYTPSLKSSQRLTSHFQGVLRIPETNYFCISGSEARYNYGQLLIGKVASREKLAGSKNKKKTIKSIIGTNVSESNSPPLEDKLIKIFDFPDKGYFHAGGMDIEGSIIAIPLEHRNGNSKIKFVNIKSPENPTLFSSSIEISRVKKTGKAGACGLTRLKNGKYLCLVWSDSDKKETKLDPRFDIYISETDDLTNGFKHNGSYLKKRVTWKQIKNHPKQIIEFQNIQIFQDDKNKIYLLATSNNGKITPYGSGTNQAHMMTLTISNWNKGDIVLLESLNIGYVTSRSFNGIRYPYNFKAGAGFYRNTNGELSLYSVSHWRSKDGYKVSFGEFSRTLTNSNQEVKHIDFAQLEFYEERDFGFKKNSQGQTVQRKRFLRLLGAQCKSVADLKEYRVQEHDKKGFHRKISSIKGIIPKGYNLNLFSDRDFSGKQFPPIKGTGEYFEIKNLHNKGFADKIRSIKLDKSA